jgi:phage repressor protein C with HTH and peptisase S24 domain
LQAENTEILQDFAFRLDGRAALLNLTQVQIAERLGVKVARVNHWFKARNFPRARERVALAEVLGVNIEWLMHGAGPVEKSTHSVSEGAAGYGEVSVREVPVISWSHAGEAATYEEMPKHWQGRVATSSRDRKAFAVIVEGDCMEPKFLPGDRVVLEPHAELRNGKPVVAKLVDDAVQLRIYTKLPSGAIRLASLKPEIYPTIDYKLADFHWIYPVRELVRSV